MPANPLPNTPPALSSYHFWRATNLQDYVWGRPLPPPGRSQYLPNRPPAVSDPEIRQGKFLRLALP